ncbi:MAG TPA: flippase [Gemmatimonadaceae bacterium]|jgi:O-antigen/teichoic acid export membrane protein
MPVFEPGATGSEQLKADVAMSMRNAIKLGASLLGTWAVALGVRIYLPRHLGPSEFGVFNFADGFTTAVYIVGSLGLETYIGKEVTTRIDHASDFFGGTLLLRLLLSAVVTVVAVFGLHAGGKTDAVIQLVLLMAAAQVLFNINGAHAALLQAAGTVDGLSVLNISSKLFWAVAIAVSLAMGGGVLSVATAMLISEFLRTVGLIYLSRRLVKLRFRWDKSATIAVVVASAPYYVASLAQTVYSRIDVSVMSFLTTDAEVGWYGSASNIAGMSLLLAPLIGWVLLPLTSRAAARSADELAIVSRRAMELILTIAFPISLALFLGADLIVPTVFGKAFSPAISSLRILAPLFIFTYAAMVGGTMLVRLGRGWALTWISLGGMIVTPLLNVWLIPIFGHRFGDGGAGIAAATALMVSEVLTTAIMTYMLGGMAFDRRSVIVVLKTVASCVAVGLLDWFLRPMAWGRLAIDAGVYIALVVTIGAVNIRETMQQMKRMRSGAAA